jgi:hypothetical protein
VLTHAVARSPPWGGLYYSIGAFPEPGTLILATSGANRCLAGSDTLMALFDNTCSCAPQLPAPTCLPYNDGTTGSCRSSYSFQASQAYVHTNSTSGGQLLASVGPYSDVKTAVFKQAITFSASYTCGQAAPPPGYAPQPHPHQSRHARLAPCTLAGPLASPLPMKHHPVVDSFGVWTLVTLEACGTKHLLGCSTCATTRACQNPLSCSVWLSEAWLLLPCMSCLNRPPALR